MDDSGLGVDVLDDGSIVAVGFFEMSLYFDEEDLPWEGIESAGLKDMFIVVLSPDGEYRWVQTLGDEGNGAAKTVASTTDGAFFVGGHFEQTVDFDPGDGVDERTVLAGADGFVSRFHYSEME